MQTKYVILIGDGMADEDNHKTPLQLAKTPNMDRLASLGEIGTVELLHEGLPLGSDVALLTLMGYNPFQYYTGRAFFEAYAKDIPIPDGSTIFRCNFVTIKDGIMVDHSAGHITDWEAEQLICLLNKHNTITQAKYYPGKGYRNILVYSKDISVECTPPHDILNQPVKEYLPKGEGAPILHELMATAKKILADNPINQRRLQQNYLAATDVWFWGLGRVCTLPSFKERFGLGGAVVCGVDLVKGIGKAIGLFSPDVEGATGYLDTSYSNKAKAATNLLGMYDFVLLHLEAPDEAGHIGSLQEKIRAIERFDGEIAGPILKFLEDNFDDFKLMVLSDHLTPLRLRTHALGPVPWLIYKSSKKIKNPIINRIFCEKSAKSGKHITIGHKLIEYFIFG